MKFLAYISLCCLVLLSNSCIFFGQWSPRAPADLKYSPTYEELVHRASESSQKEGRPFEITKVEVLKMPQHYDQWDVLDLQNPLSQYPDIWVRVYCAQPTSEGVELNRIFDSATQRDVNTRKPFILRSKSQRRSAYNQCYVSLLEKHPGERVPRHGDVIIRHKPFKLDPPESGNTHSQTFTVAVSVLEPIMVGSKIVAYTTPSSPIYKDFVFRVHTKWY